MKKIGKILLILVLIGIGISLWFLAKGYHMYKMALEAMPLEQKIKEIRAKETFYPISSLPQIYIDAVVSVEDHRFFEHHGIDFIAISRAIFYDIKAMDFVQGGSTITQQLAKNIYFTQEKRMERKIAEVFMARALEKALNKQEILELYLNTSYFGDGYYTVGEASMGYFGKDPKDMNDYECVMLAGIPNAPSVYAPTQNKELAEQRQKQVLQSMIKYHYLSQKEADVIIKQNEE